MSKIDVSQIEGYAEMSPEEKLKALEALEITDPDYSGYVKKEVFDKTASELAEKKRALREKMSEDEAAKQKEQEERERLQSDYEKLLYETTVARYKAKLLALGYEEKLADDTAVGMANGDSEKVFVNQKRHIEAVERKVRAGILIDTPNPTPDGGFETVTLEKFRTMTPTERYLFSIEHPEEYRELYGGNH